MNKQDLKNLLDTRDLVAAVALLRAEQPMLIDSVGAHGTINVDWDDIDECLAGIALVLNKKNEVAFQEDMIEEIVSDALDNWEGGESLYEFSSLDELIEHAGEDVEVSTYEICDTYNHKDLYYQNDTVFCIHTAVENWECWTSFDEASDYQPSLHGGFVHNIGPYYLSILDLVSMKLDKDVMGDCDETHAMINASKRGDDTIYHTSVEVDERGAENITFVMHERARRANRQHTRIRPDMDVIDMDIAYSRNKSLAEFLSAI